jgi:hypothetical protein
MAFSKKGIVVWSPVFSYIGITFLDVKGKMSIGIELQPGNGRQSSPFAPQSTFIYGCDPFDPCLCSPAILIILNAPPLHAYTIDKIHNSNKTEPGAP